MDRRTRRLAGTAALAAALVVVAHRSPAEEAARLPTGDAVLDRNGDGLQDVVFIGPSVYVDLDGDGWFDYGLTLAFRQHTAEAHRRYVASGLAADVFAEITRKGLDGLCASERVAADWTARHFAAFPYFHDGYGRLTLLDRAPGNDGRLPAQGPHPEYVVDFNPDGTVASVRHGERTVALAAFDYDKNVSSGTRLTLPRVATPADLAAIRTELGRLFAGGG